MFCFTDWVPNIDDQQLMGYMTLLSLGIIVVVNLSFVLFYLPKDIMLVIVKYYRIVDKKYGDNVAPTLEFYFGTQPGLEK